MYRETQEKPMTSALAMKEEGTSASYDLHQASLLV